MTKRGKTVRRGRGRGRTQRRRRTYRQRAGENRYETSKDKQLANLKQKELLLKIYEDSIPLHHNDQNTAMIKKYNDLNNEVNELKRDYENTPEDFSGGRRRRTYRRGGGGDVEPGDGTYAGFAGHTTRHANEYDDKARTFFKNRIINGEPAIKQYAELRNKLGSKDAYEEMQRRDLSQYY